MAIEALDHYTIVTDDLERSTDFYCNVIGLQNGARPPFSVPGAWLYCGERAVLHLVGSDKDRPAVGRLDHAALRASGYEEILARLKAGGHKYRENQLPGGGLWQVFITTPEKVTLELVFQETEIPEAHRKAAS